MAAKYIKIPIDFFDREPILSLMQLPEGTSLVLLYFELLLESYQEGGKGTITINNIDLTDEDINAILSTGYSNIGGKLRVLEEHGLILRNLTSIQTFKFWVSKHDRNSDRYKKWRKAVFVRDLFHCQHCGSPEHIQAHHIKSWMRCEEQRYDVSNGITLCRSCHLKAHGGCWKNV